MRHFRVLHKLQATLVLMLLHTTHSAKYTLGISILVLYILYLPAGRLFVASMQFNKSYNIE